MVIFMNKGFVRDLASKFVPTYVACENEKCYLVELEPKETPRVLRAYPAWNPFVYFSVVELEPQGDLIAYEINYLTIWDWDTGGIIGALASHRWDTERTAILVTGPRNKGDATLFTAKEAYYAAHEGVPFVDRSKFYPCLSEGCGVTVYLSFGKHASYPHLNEFPTYDKFKSPGIESKPTEYTLVDIGTVEDPIMPWLVYGKPWGPKVGPLSAKLEKRLWNRRTWEKIERASYSKDQIQWFQRISNLPTTGELDTETIRAVWTDHVDPHLVQNFEKFPDKVSGSILSSSLRGRDIDLIAKARLPSRKIEGIIKKELRGKALRSYLKKEVK